MASVDAMPRIGGVSNFAHFCTNELANVCERVVFVGPSGTCMPKNYHCKYDLIEDVKSQKKSRFGKRSDKEFTRIENLFTRIIDRYSLNRVFLFHPFYYGPPAAAVSKKLGLPFELVVYGTELTSQFPEAVAGNGDIEPRNIESLPFHLFSTMHRADRLIAISRYTAMIARNIIPEASIAVSCCGISAETFEIGQSKAASSLLQKKMRRLALGGSERPQLCFIGRLVRHKRVDKIFSLISLLDADLVIVGDGPLREELRAETIALNISERVRFEGQVSDERKWDLLAASDFLMLPSEYDDVTGGYEGFGIVILESIAAGTIPICSGDCGTADPTYLFDLGIAGLNSDRDVETTAQKMNELLSDVESYKSKLQRDTITIKENLMWSNVAANITRGWSYE